MIKLNELMMGLFCRLNKGFYFFKKGQILKVLTITYYQFVTNSVKCEDASGYVSFFGVDCLDPIPLTEDILKKIGFEKTMLVVPSYILCDNIFTVFAKKISDRDWLIDVLKTDFNLPDQSAIVHNVHQLQRWLRFCGIEREIKMSSLTSINTY